MRQGWKVLGYGLGCLLVGCCLAGCAGTRKLGPLIIYPDPAGIRFWAPDDAWRAGIVMTAQAPAVPEDPTSMVAARP